MSLPEFEKLKADVLEATKELKAKSDSIAKLTTDNAALTAQVADLQAQLAAATAGVPVGDIIELDAQLAPALDAPPAV